MDKIFQSAREAWTLGATLRSRRSRMKAYTYGDQWSDRRRLADGRIVTEYEHAVMNGARPITNNLLRQLVKSVVGNFRAMRAADGPVSGIDPAVAARNQLDELDARTLEEFLISGCAIQRVVTERRPQGDGVWVDCVSPSHFFAAPFSDPRGLDIELLGMVRDMSPAEAVMRFGGTDPAREDAVLDACRDCDSGGAFGDTPRGRIRVIEVWALETVRVLRCHDTATGRLCDTEPAQRGAIDAINADRARRRLPGITAWTHHTARWRGSWFTTSGQLLHTTISPWRHGSHPFAVKFYPLIDGEIHPFVEDIIDQQRHVNRLITMIDQLMGVSAKGALLFPVDAMPKGLSMRELLADFGQPGAIIPYKETPRAGKPEVVTSSADSSGAARLLDIELKMMQQVSGVSSALQGMHVDGVGGSASLYNAQAANSATALRDIFDTFKNFCDMRNSLITCI